MRRRRHLWRRLERLTSFLPGGPEDPPHHRSVPDPNEPGISAETRRARLRLLLQLHDKKGRGSGR